MEIVIGISGASGAGYGIRLLEIIGRMNQAAEKTGQEQIKIHLVMTKAAEEIIRLETGRDPADIKKLADYVHDENNFTAPIASGSYKTAGMIIAPCSMKTLGQIANGIADNLMARAADVCLKDERKLILMTRETPLNLIHLENMVRAKKAGATIMPASPGFYGKPQTIDDLYDIMTGRALDLLGVDNDVYKRWKQTAEP
ncbi:Flavin prenyltransferase UbiX [Methanosarcinaceae archaeon Ag5]|uniref:Flavin prenyltransferase UbiX n=1 Tax=Methanolapillus africanus TaxID=3028297 RepID=A0AAE4MHZ9_9EURY|nr:Flavin prenyltransferase UbiX [Methanosarcinaceae archaeon Ag5]